VGASLLAKAFVQALVFWGTYPLLRSRPLRVPPLRRVTFFKRQKGNPKGLLLRTALAGSGPFAPGLIRAQRLRFASLHLLPLCLAAPDGRCAPTPGSIPPLSLPTSPVDQDQEHSSLRSLLSGAASPRAAALLCFCFCGSEPAREGGLTADLFLTERTRSNCGSWLASEGGLTADLLLTERTRSNCGSWLASEGGLTADLFLADVLDSNCGSEPAREGGLTADLFLTERTRSNCGSWLASEGGQSVNNALPDSPPAQPTSLLLSLRHKPVQYAVDRQFAQHDHLLYPQQGAALRSIDKSGEVAGHDARRGQ